jgi:hypothetical protein
MQAGFFRGLDREIQPAFLYRFLAPGCSLLVDISSRCEALITSGARRVHFVPNLKVGVFVTLRAPDVVKLAAAHPAAELRSMIRAAAFVS